MGRSVVESLAHGRRLALDALVRLGSLWAAILSMGSTVSCSHVVRHDDPAETAERARVSPLPPVRDTYGSEARPGGVVGGPPAERLAQEVEKSLAARGNAAVADGALAELAAWTLAEATLGRNPDATNTERVVRRSGFAGVVYAVGAYPKPGDDAWRALLDALGNNLVINRFGVVLDEEGRRAIALGSMQVELASIPRYVKPGGVILLRGEVSSRFASGSVFLTTQDGSTRRLPGTETRLDMVIEFDEPGRYKLELMGDGPTGPVVVANLPIYVGVDPPAIQPTPKELGPLDPERAAAELFELLNQARRKANLRPLQSDARLRSIALAHSEDMAQHHFFGHVSPSTGTPTDRMDRAGAVASKYGENVARGPNAKSAYDLLMDSPGHRANMLRNDFTHVGIGVTTYAPYGRQEILATLVFSRRPSLAETLKTDEEALEVLAKYRRKRGQPDLSANPRLSGAAKMGMAAFTDQGVSKEQAIDVSAGALEGIGDVCAAFVEVLELYQLRNYPALSDPNLESLGVAVAARSAGDGVVLHVLLLFKARDGSTVHCE